MFGIAKDVRSEVRVCTPDLLKEALDSPCVARTCAEIEDALEAYRRGELTQDEFETKKGELKKRLPILTPHATFRNGRRKNDEAIPSGLSIYDIDHIPNPREKWAEIVVRKEELGILMAHITPSTEGLRLVFVIPQAPGANRLMTLAEAQAWMAVHLGDTRYDACVKDFARCSFLVPREYVLYLSDALFDSPQIFSDRVLNNSSQINTDFSLGHADDAPSLVVLPSPLVILNEVKDLNTSTNTPVMSFRAERSEAKNLGNINVDVHEILRHSVPQNDKNSGFPQTYNDIPYKTIVETLEEQMGGRPEHGSRNNFIFSMACHLRYVCNDDPDWIATVLPTYGEGREKWMHSIRSACARNQTQAMPNIMRRTLSVCKQILRSAQNDREGNTNDKTGDGNPPKMPDKLPPLIELLVSRTPDIYKAAVAHAVFPPLAAHLWKTYFQYIDNVLHEATLMNVLMAGTGAGKTVSVSRLTASWRISVGVTVKTCIAKKHGRKRCNPRVPTRTNGSVRRG